MADTKTEATSYLLTMLLQRIEAQLPGTLDDMIEGVKSDQASVSGTPVKGRNIHEVFEEALRLLAIAAR